MSHASKGNKETFISQFDSAKNGSTHLQKWAIKNMEDFHNSIKFKISLGLFTWRKLTRLPGLSPLTRLAELPGSIEL